MSVCQSKIAGGHRNLRVAGNILKNTKAFLKNDNTITIEDIAILNGNDRILTDNGAILTGDNAILNSNNAFPKDNGGFLMDDGAILNDDNAFLKDNGNFLMDNGGFLKYRTREFAQKCSFWDSGRFWLPANFGLKIC